jgi:hypothetical protein
MDGDLCFALISLLSAKQKTEEIYQTYNLLGMGMK